MPPLPCLKTWASSLQWGLTGGKRTYAAQQNRPGLRPFMYFGSSSGATISARSTSVSSQKQPWSPGWSTAFKYGGLTLAWLPLTTWMTLQPRRSGGGSGFTHTGPPYRVERASTPPPIYSSVSTCAILPPGIMRPSALSATGTSESTRPSRRCTHHSASGTAPCPWATRTTGSGVLGKCSPTTTWITTLTPSRPCPTQFCVTASSESGMTMSLPTSASAEGA